MLSILAALPLLVPAVQQDAKEVAQQYQRLHEAGADEKLEELWRSNPDKILVTIDADLEGALSLWEKADGKPDEDEVAALHARAMWGAEAASRATGRPIFVDYVSSFVGWTPEQKKRFRQGQAAFGRAGKAQRDGDAQAALAAGQECLDLALPLGDWWGTAMGLSAVGRAQAMLGDHEAAASAFSRARLLYSQLGLTSSELQNLFGLTQSLVKLERKPRARAAAMAGARLAEEAGNKGLAQSFEALLATLK